LPEGGYIIYLSFEFLSSPNHSQTSPVIGQTGTGKSTLLRNLILQDIDEGRGVGFIDPHGDVAEELLDCIPSHRTDHVAYFNPADLEYPVGLNPLQKTHRDMHHLVVDSIIATLKSIWGDVWGTGRMQYVMHHTLSEGERSYRRSILDSRVRAA
jgi:uncharacterized protein DUF87